MNELLIFVERNEYSIDSLKDIIKKLKENNFVRFSDNKKFYFIVTGFIIINNRPIVIFPKNYLLPNKVKDIKNESMLLLKVLLKYKMEKKHDSEEISYPYGYDENNISRVMSSFLLLEDYMNNGIIRRKINIKAQNRCGAIEWSTTVNKTMPYIVQGRPMYLEPFMKSRMINNDDFLSFIHKYVVSECIKKWGWLFGCTDELLENSKLLYETDVIIYYLKKELVKTYVQRDIFIIKSLISYFESTIGEDKMYNMEVMVTYYFDYVWESICAYIYENEYSTLSKWVAQPIWESNLINKQISHKPDILFINNDTFYILDAKYYNYNISVPGWSDIVKQLYYQHIIKAKIESSNEIFIKKYENILILPENSEKSFTYIGKVYINDVPDLGEIKAFAINTKEAMKTYVLGSKSNFREQLIREIDKL